MKNGKRSFVAARGFLAVLALAFVSLAQASTSSFLNDEAPMAVAAAGGGWVLTQAAWAAAPAVGRVWSSATAGFTATDILPIAGRAGNLAVTVAQTVAKSDGVALLGACLLNPLCAVSTAAVAAYGVYRLQVPSNVPGSVVSAGSFDYDPGQTGTVTNPYCSTNQMNYLDSTVLGTFCDVSVVAVGGAVVSALNLQAALTKNLCGTAPSQYLCKQFRITSGTGWTDYQLAVKSSSGGAWTDSSFWSVSAVQTQITNCPASIDPLNSAYNVPAGGPVGPDGLCPSARYYHTPMTKAQAIADVNLHPPVLPNSGWAQGVQDAINQGQVAPATITSSGVASQVGAASVSTSVASGVTTTTTATPTYNYTYAGDTIGYTTTNVTTVNNGTTITTTTNNPAAAAPQDQTDPCTANPTRVGCLAEGVPVDGVMPKSSIPVAIAPVTFAAGGGCPADIPVNYSILGQSLHTTFSYSAACSAAVSIIAPVLMLLSVFLSAMLFVGGLKA